MIIITTSLSLVSVLRHNYSCARIARDKRTCSNESDGPSRKLRLRLKNIVKIYAEIYVTIEAIETNGVRFSSDRKMSLYVHLAPFLRAKESIMNNERDTECFARDERETNERRN